MVLMSEIEPQPGMARRLPDYRQHIRQTRPRAHPGLGIDGVSQREQRVRPRQGLLDLDVTGRPVAAGKFDAGGETDAAAHRRQQIALIGIENGMIEYGITARRQMQMIPALDPKRDGIPERTKYQIGPGSQRHDNFARDRGAIATANTPSAGNL